MGRIFDRGTCAVQATYPDVNPVADSLILWMEPGSGIEGARLPDPRRSPS